MYTDRHKTAREWLGTWYAEWEAESMFCDPFDNVWITNYMQWAHYACDNYSIACGHGYSDGSGIAKVGWLNVY